MGTHNEPRKGCLVLQANGLWRATEWLCKEELPFICRFRDIALLLTTSTLPTISPVSTPTTPTLPTIPTVPTTDQPLTTTTTNSIQPTTTSKHTTFPSSTTTGFIPPIWESTDWGTLAIFLAGAFVSGIVVGAGLCGCTLMWMRRRRSIQRTLS